MRIAGRSFGNGAKFIVLQAIALAGCAASVMLPRPSDAETPSRAEPAAFYRVAQNSPGSNEAVAPGQRAPASQAPSAAPAEALPAATAPVPSQAAVEPAVPEKPPVDGLRITSQSWRRGGLGSKALVTFTLRNGNSYAVKDIEIACAFLRLDGSHLTSRRRVLPDTVSMNSRKRYSGMLVGFVNVYATKAKCSAVAANRI